jgi:hypothetical protein
MKVHRSLGVISSEVMPTFSRPESLLPTYSN